MNALQGKNILITRSPEDQEEAAALVRDRGANPVACPVISMQWPKDTKPLDHAIQTLEGFEWLIFTSPNSVRFFIERCKTLGLSTTKLAARRIAVIGPATQAEVHQYNLTAEFVAETSTGENFVDEFAIAYPVSGKSFLIPLSSIARRTVPETLKLLGARAKQVIAYQNIPIRELPASVLEMMANHTIDWVIFTSSSTVDNFIAALPADLPWSEHCRIASIGPKTSETLHKYDIHPSVEAQEHTLRGLLHAMST